MAWRLAPAFYFLAPLVACILTDRSMATATTPTAVNTGAFGDDLTWVRGVNYVPSTAHNDMGIWLDYNSTLVCPAAISVSVIHLTP